MTKTNSNTWAYTVNRKYEAFGAGMIFKLAQMKD